MDSVRGKAELERQLDAELRFDYDQRVAEKIRAGMSEADARRAVRLEFGGIEQIKEECRDQWALRFFYSVGRDARYALRIMRRSPGFTAIAVATLALGIGATTAMFALMNAVLLKSLPVRDPVQLVVLGKGHAAGVSGPDQGSFSLYSWDLYKHLKGANVFEALCAFDSENFPVSAVYAGWSGPHATVAKIVSGNYFEVLGASVARGRTISAHDDLPASPPVAVVSFRYWRDRFHGDGSVLGSVVDVNSVPVTIIGIAEPEFYGDTLGPDPPSFWIPLSAMRQLDTMHHLVNSPDKHFLYLMGRLNPGISVAQAQARLTVALHDWLLAQEGTGVSSQRRREISGNYIEFTPGGGGIPHLQHDYSETLKLLLGISAAVLLIACANIANFLLARGAARGVETSIRLALGASPARLVRQRLTESLMLALAGGALGLPVAFTGTKLLIALVFRGATYIPVRTAPDLRVLAFTFAVSCGTAVAFGLLPAMRIRFAGRGVKNSAPVNRRFSLGKMLIAGEVALSLVVLAGASCFARSLANLSGQQFGFSPDNVLVVNIDPVLAHYEYNKLGPLYRQIYARLNALPGVKSASLSYYSPFNGCCWGETIAIEGYTSNPSDPPGAYLNRVSPRYFETIGTKILRGRTFDEHDSASSKRVAVVTEEFVRSYLPNGNPIGVHFGIGDDLNRGDLEIVGVVENAKYTHIKDKPNEMAFLPLAQVRSDDQENRNNLVGTIEVRSNGDPAALAGSVRAVLAEIAPTLPVIRIGTLSGDVRATLNQDHVIADLAEFFAALALMLTCIGLYGLMSWMVQRRTSEIGVRTALGASRGAVMAMVIREALVQGLAGVLVGIPLALVATRLIASQLYGVTPADPRNLIVAAAVLLLCITIAGYLPARRAASVDPAVALRYE